MHNDYPVRTQEEIEALLASLAEPDEPWIQHVRKTADVAGRIADALQKNGIEIDTELVRTSALLHDVGRSRDHGYLHGWEGYQILIEKGFGIPSSLFLSVSTKPGQIVSTLML